MEKLFQIAARLFDGIANMLGVVFNGLLFMMSNTRRIILTIVIAIIAVQLAMPGLIPSLFAEMVVRLEPLFMAILQLFIVCLGLKVMWVGLFGNKNKKN